jgi:hypothetical protein
MPANQVRGNWVEPRRFLLPFVPKRDRKVFLLFTNIVGTGAVDDGWTQSGGLCGGRLRRPDATIQLPSKGGVGRLRRPGCGY